MDRVQPGAPGAPAGPESERQRLNRNFNELLQEVRVAQTGVQILFGFLLTVPFSNRWPRVTVLQEVVYTLTVLACAVAVALLIAPVSLHRQVFRQGRKVDVVDWADNLARAGLRALVLAVVGVVFLVLDAVRGVALAAPLSAAVACIYLVLWYRLPKSVANSPGTDDSKTPETPDTPAIPDAPDGASLSSRGAPESRG